MPISADGRIQWLDRYGFGQHTNTIYNSVPSGPGGKRGKKGEIEEQENKEPEEENMEEVVEEDEEAVETAAAMRGGRDSNNNVKRRQQRWQQKLWQRWRMRKKWSTDLQFQLSTETLYSIVDRGVIVASCYC